MRMKIKPIPEEIQWQVIGGFGSVFAFDLKKANEEYWQSVWNWLCVAHPDILDDPTTDYAGPEDIKILNAMHDWQNRRYPHEKEN